MKKLFLACILLSAFTGIHAQKSQMKIGISAGINVSNITDQYSGGMSSSYSPSSQVGFKGALFFEMPVSRVFSFQTEVGYDVLGFQFTDPTGSVSGTFNNQLDYLIIGLLPKVNVGETGLSFFAGPSLGLLLNSKLSDQNGNSSSSDDSFNPTDVFANLGAEYFFPAGLGFTTRYMWGLENIGKGTVSGETVHNHAFSFTIAYKFR